MSSGPSDGAGESQSKDSSEDFTNAFQTMPNDFRSALDEFRTNWQSELQQKQSNTNSGHLNMENHASRELQTTKDTHRLINNEETDKEALAKNLYHKAVELEQSGKVYDAIPFYRKAVQIEPNIEFMYYEQQRSKANAQNAIKLELNTNTPTKSKHDGNVLVEDGLIKNLYEKFQQDLSQGQLLQNSRDTGVISTGVHISALPPELLIYILRWVVSNQLDMRSLENCAAVCRGMYILARDDELWKSACAKVWDHNVDSLIQSTAKEEQPADVQRPALPRYSTWRQMFIERERVHFNGCYISKTTYLRMGENSFQDQYYRPVQLVEYYRYIRFLPDGTVLMITSSDEPAQGVNKLKNLHQIRPDVLKGHYRLFGSKLSIVVSKQQQQTKLIANATNGLPGYGKVNGRNSATCEEVSPNSSKYCMELLILNTSKRKFAQLKWLHYSVIHLRNSYETRSEFDLTPSKYPPLWFSPVRSYHLDADAPLA